MRAMLMIVGSIETALTKKRGDQPSLYASTNAWIAYVGRAKTMKVSALDWRSLAICDLMSVSVTSYDCLARICEACLPSPRCSPWRRSLP
jgi:hypothetical protein